jgi:hypothetical protein
VAVTDGINVTLTDTKGRYELLSNKTTEFVYGSMPKGYAFTNTRGITEFYKRIDHKSDSFKADFELKKLSVDDTRHCFIVWA